VSSDVEKLLFYRGLLFGLRAAGETSFLAEGTGFHRAFGSTLQRATELFSQVEGYRVIDFAIDPVFGVYPEANEMLLEGEQDTVLSLANPHLRRAKFEVEETEAQEELRRLPHSDIFEELGRFFRAELARVA
jgi:catechol 2,3-dioxygenase-like lactoylglutathione lyase family enzyme